jgi:putative transcription factor
MICELCGKETPKTRTVLVEGTELKVCPECAKFGEDRSTTKKETGPKAQIAQRLERRERRMRSRDVYSQGETLELAEDYSNRIRKARMSRDWKQEDLASKINEKKSVITKIESGHMRPSDSLIGKLEKALGITLMEKVPLMKPDAKQSSSKGMTLADFVKVEK